MRVLLSLLVLILVESLSFQAEATTAAGALRLLVDEHSSLSSCLKCRDDKDCPTGNLCTSQYVCAVDLMDCLCVDDGCRLGFVCYEGMCVQEEELFEQQDKEEEDVLQQKQRFLATDDDDKTDDKTSKKKKKGFHIDFAKLIVRFMALLVTAVVILTLYILATRRGRGYEEIPIALNV